MNKFLKIAITTLMGTMFTSAIAIAADLDYYEAKDRSYIDRTLDEFERKTGQGRFYKDQQKWDYENEEYKNNKEQYDLKDHSHLDNAPYQKHKRHKFERNWQDECLPKRKIRRSLIKRGWHDFHILRRGPRRIKLLATNYNGRRFKLVLNACTGHIIRRVPMRKYWGWR